MSDQQSAVHEAMAVLGDSPTAMAKALSEYGEPVSRQNVEHWLKVGRVPAERAPSVEDLTRKAGRAIPCERLCPGPRWGAIRRRSAKVAV